MRHRFIAVSLCLMLGAAPIRHAFSAPKADPNALGADLIIAIRMRDSGGVSKALAQGADPNFRNWLGLTPLMFAAAAADPPLLRLLIEKKADVEAKSIYGTALTFAALGGNPENVQLLLGKGANLLPDRIDGITPLMIAASQGYVPVAKLLLAKKPDLNRKDGEGQTALMHAARSGQTEIARLLIAQGATINLADKKGLTTLMYAAKGGHGETAKLLLQRGANVNAVDLQGRTALMLAARYAEDPTLLRELLSRKANAVATDKQGRTALRLAEQRGNPECIRLLSSTSENLPARSDDAAKSRQAAQAGLAQIQRSVASFSKTVGCTSCHHQGLALITTGAARDKGIPVDEKLASTEMEKIYKEMVAGPKPAYHQALTDPNVEKMIPAIDMEEFSIAMSFALMGVDAHHKPADESLSTAVRLLAKQQSKEGNWRFTLPRVPMQSSYFSVTAQTVRLMKAYATKEWEGEAAERIGRAKAWMKNAPVRSTEDMTFRLLGLKWAGATTQELQAETRALLESQRPDGGWASEPTLRSDAYATGQALYALRQAGGISADDPAVRRGREFLLRTQDEDGTWFVNKRAIPANTYLDAEFPHGHSQYASFNATCWATMALLQDLPDTPAKRHVAEAP
ncbi:MAG: ankyrin repeat domain-containing protein [Armatimonadetes bacterium]|nr:ankyrin repeat domain-containing protein [Armatimonadota bacterium]